MTSGSGIRTRIDRSLLVTAMTLASSCAHRRTAPPNPIVYVSDEYGGAVLAVDPGTGTGVARISLGKRPRGLELSRDGTRLFVGIFGPPVTGPGLAANPLCPAVYRSTTACSV